MDYLIGTDIGTSGTKTIVMDTSGKLMASDLEEYDVLTPRALWAEQWPDVWADAAKRSIAGAFRKAGIRAEDVKGICKRGLYGGSGKPMDRDKKTSRKTARRQSCFCRRTHTSSTG